MVASHMRGLLLSFALFAAALAGCPKAKPFDAHAAEQAIDRVSLATCSQIADDLGAALVIVTFDPATGRARKVDVDEAPAEPNETLHSPRPKPETASCIVGRIGAEARVAAFSGPAAEVRRKVVILRMEDWHRP
jgi:hypothetical protein